MVWKKLISSKELIVMENNGSDRRFRIEARKEGNKWYVYHIRLLDDEAEILNEYVFEDRRDVMAIIRKIVKQKDPTKKTISIKRNFNIDLTREYKEELVEKWKFVIDNTPHNNFVFIRYDDNLKVDVVMNHQYKHHEKHILDMIESKLALKDFADRISYDIYYFNKSNRRYGDLPGRPEMAGNIYIEFGQDPEE